MENFKIHPKFNYLEKEFKPITVCVYGMDHSDEKTSINLDNLTDSQYFNAVNVDYNEHPDILNCKNLLNSGKQTYVISEVSEKDKFSKDFYNCTGVVIVGENKNGKNVSILSHQDPAKFLSAVYDDEFENDLTTRILELKKDSKEGSIDALIFGGNSYFNDFKESINVLKENIKKNLNIDVTVATGPKEHAGGTSVYFDTINRRLYLIMPKQENTEIYKDFLAKDIDQKII